MARRLYRSSSTMRTFDMAPALVTGGTGLIGRWLVVELSRDREVIAIVRRAVERRDDYVAWIAAHGGVAERVTLIEGDLAAADLGLDDEGKRLARTVRDVFH